MTRASSHLDLGALVAWWFGESPEEDERVEEHLLSCDACGARARELVLLGDGVRRAARAGLAAVVVTPEFLAAAARDGLRTREYRVSPGGRVDCTVRPEDDLVVGRLAADFTGVSRVDVVAAADGEAEQRLEDVPVSASCEVIVAQHMPALRARGRFDWRVRLVTRDGAGERLLGEYLFAHAPSPR